MAEISTDKVGWGSAFGDLDLDGRVDLAVANGSTLEDDGSPKRLRAQPMFLLWNSGDRFYDLAPDAGEVTAAGHVARGLAACDFDGDGDLDLAISVNRGRPLLLENRTDTDGRSLTVRPKRVDARSLGALIQVTAGEARQVRWLGADVSFASAHAPALLFGLGADAEWVDVGVRWADGQRLELRGVPVGHRLRLPDPG
jgi:hypothetical protein